MCEKMYDNIYNSMNQVSPISRDSFDSFIQLCVLKTYPAKTTLIKIGDLNKKVFLILDGVTRIFSVNERGKEITKAFYTKGGYTTVIRSNLFNLPSPLEIQTLTDCTILEFHHTDIQELAKNKKDFALYQLKALQHIIIGLEKRLKSLTTHTAKDNYLQLISDIPNINEIIPQTKIATYLGVTSTQLGRIKSKLRQENEKH